MDQDLIFVIVIVTALAFDSGNANALMYAQLQEAQLHNVKQWTTEPQGAEREILLATAEAFRLAALIYLRCRLYG